MTIGRWRLAARRVIDAETAKWRQENGFEAVRLHDLPDDAKPLLLRHLSATYPFGTRDHYPYTAWLQEIRLVKVALGLEKPRTPTERKKRDDEAREAHPALELEVLPASSRPGKEER